MSFAAWLAKTNRKLVSSRNTARRCCEGDIALPTEVRRFASCVHLHRTRISETFCRSGAPSAHSPVPITADRPLHFVYPPGLGSEPGSGGLDYAGPGLCRYPLQ